MSNESSRPLKPLQPLPEDVLRVVRLIDHAAASLDIPFLLAGAAARDTVLVNLWGMRAGRATADIDFAFSVRDWTHFHELRDALVATSVFQRLRHQEQRLAYTDPEHGFSIPVDLVPFHGVARADQKIEWPPEGDFVMNVAGFEEALVSALLIEAEPGLVVRVTSIPGLLLLKLVAWLDRNVINSKDADDIFTLLKSYASAGNEARIYEHEYELLETFGYDLTLVGAYLLGRDAERIAGKETAHQVRELLTSERHIDRLLSQIVGVAASAERSRTAEDILQRFRSGFLEGTDSNPY